MNLDDKKKFKRNLTFILVCFFIALAIISGVIFGLYHHHSEQRQAQLNKENGQEIYYSKNQHVSTVGWHKGMPKDLAHQHLWASSAKQVHSKPVRKLKWFTTFSFHNGGNPFSVLYNKDNQPISNGNVSSATESEHPYHKMIGNHIYEIVSGNHKLAEDIYGYRIVHNHQQGVNSINRLTIEEKSPKHLIIWNNWGKQKDNKVNYYYAHQSVHHLMKEINHNK